jgi:hypothetical protein
MLAFAPLWRPCRLDHARSVHPSLSPLTSGSVRLALQGFGAKPITAERIAGDASAGGRIMVARCKPDVEIIEPLIVSEDATHVVVALESRGRYWSATAGFSRCS